MQHPCQINIKDISSLYDRADATGFCIFCDFLIQLSNQTKYNALALPLLGFGYNRWRPTVTDGCCSL